MEVVSAEDLKNLLEHLSKNPFRVRDQDSKTEAALKKCKELFSKDYKFNVIPNQNGELVTTYPSELIIPQQTIFNCYRHESHLHESNSVVDNFCDSSKLRDLMVKARVARCRARFPAPVIFVDGKYICRSATLSGGPEIYGRSGYDFLFAANTDVAEDDDLKEIAIPESSSEWQLFTKVRNQDIRLLKALSVGYICDLMVEKKKVKFGMNVTSSEKVDKENRYGEFTILSLPYPGCEFFRDYRDNGYNAEGLVFDWNQAFVDAQLGVPSDSLASQLEVEWNTYKSWDLVTLTQNYVRLLLKYLVEGTSGLLIHCISGWDRTPLFISLLRLSLWADGKAHASLSPAEILYLTVAYDWYLFGHDLPDRLSKGEEIFFFCFYSLKFLHSEEFSIHALKNNRSTRNGSDCHLDGVLLDDDPLKSVVGGSNTSLNSSCSSVSTRSQDNNPPVYFSTGAPIPPVLPTCQTLPDLWEEEDNHLPNNNNTNGNHTTYQPCQHNHLHHLSSQQQAYLWACSQQQRAKETVEDPPTLTPAGGVTPPTLTNSSDTLCCSLTNGNSPSYQNMASFSNSQCQCQSLSCPCQSHQWQHPPPPHVVSGIQQCPQRLSPAASITSQSSTSPVAVPCQTVRQRSESSSSIGCGSWQIISGTGSIRGSASTRSSLSSPTLELNQNSAGNGKSSLSQDSGEYLPEPSPQQRPSPCCWQSSCQTYSRKERLQKVRDIFYNAYGMTIGYKFRNGTENRGLSNLLDLFSERVGFRSARSTTV